MTFLDFAQPKSPPIHCKFIPSSFKDCLAQCYAFRVRRRSPPTATDESLASDVEDERVIVLAVRTRALRAKLRRKDSMRSTRFRWVFSPATGELFLATRAREREKEEEEEGNEDKEEDGHESFYSVKTHFSESSSNLTGIDYHQHIRRRLILEELAQCEGWPFGLCRKALLLPPLPHSPSESWTWCGQNPTGKIPYY